MGLFGKKKPKDGAAKADAKAGKKDAKKGAPAAEESKEDPKGGGKDAKDGKKDKKTLKAEKAAEKAKKKKAYDEQMALFEAMEKEGTFVECFQCFEEAEERVCCRAQLCDHCYGNTGACPSCGIAVKDNQPIAEDPRTKATSLDDRLELNNMDEAAMAAERERQLAVDVKQELLECRICLNPGVRRKCCGGCICDNCYNKKTHCPACGKSAAKRGLASFSLNDPGLWPVLCGWCLTAWVLGLVVGAGFLIVYVERKDMRTLHGYTCYGFLPRCDRLECIELYSKANAPVASSESRPRSPLQVGANETGYPSAAPSFAPSLFPSLAPSLRPTDTFAPTGLPTPNATLAANATWAPSPAATAAAAAGADAGDDGDLHLVNMATWKRCDLDSVVKIIGSTCIFDYDLWSQSGHMLGFDFCVGTNALRQDKQVDGDEVSTARFAGGVYVFDDNFAWWGNETSHKSNIRGSALWESIEGAEVDDKCGAHSEGTALHFFGKDLREAVTKPLDVRYGGHVNLRLKLAPTKPGDDASCRGNYGAAITIYYNVADSPEWVPISTLEASTYAYEVFNLVSAKIPVNGSTASTRFKISQPSFLRERDHWAIDDVNIFHKFESGWKSSEWWGKALSDAHDDVGVAQCCYDTDQCEIAEPEPASTRPGTMFRKGCDAVFKLDVPSNRRKRYAGQRTNGDPYVDPEDESRFYTRINGAHFFVSLAGLAQLYNFVYFLVKVYFTQGAQAVWKLVLPDVLMKWLGRERKIMVIEEDPDDPYAEYGDMEVEEDPDDAQLKQVFELDVDGDWQRRFLAYTCVPYAGAFFLAMINTNYNVLYTPVHAWGAPLMMGAVWVVPVPKFFVFVLAAALDAKPLYLVAKNVVCVLPRWIHLIHLNLFPEVNALMVGSENAKDAALHVPLSAMEEMSRFTKRQCVGMAFLYVLACQPFALVALAFDSFKFEYDSVDRYVSGTLGAVTIVRALCGYDIFMKAALGSGFLFSQNSQHRNQIGDAVCEKRTKWITIYTMLSTFLAAGILFPSDESGHVQTRKIEIFQGIVLVAFASFFYGMLVGFVQGLPVTPSVRLTKIDGGLYFTFLSRTHCPCFHHFHECSTMHSRRQIIVLFVEDIMTFIARLKGEEADEDTTQFLLAVA